MNPDEAELKEYEVTLPSSGTIYMTVQAANEDAAIEQALDTCEQSDINSWEAHRYLVRGNVFYGERSEAYAEEV